MPRSPDPPPGYLVIADRGGQRLYLGEDDTWWDDRGDARVFATEREAGLAVKGSELATGYVAAALSRPRTGGG